MAHRNGKVDGRARAVATALAALTENELHTLAESVNHAPQLAPGLLAWVEHTASWELRRRRGAPPGSLTPSTTITRSDEAASITVAATLRHLFETESPRIAAFFAVIGEAIVGGGRPHRVRWLRRDRRLEPARSD